MGGMETMVRTEVAVNGGTFYVAQGQDIELIKRRITEAVRDGGDFVDFVVVGNRQVSVLFTSSTQVAFSVETVQYDPRDTGDDTSPFGGRFDLL